MLRKILILSEIGGCVLVQSESFMPALCKGLTIYIGAVTLLADARGMVFCEIFSRADASPSGYLVNLADEASARYSRFLESAKYSSVAIIGASIAAAIAMSIRIA
mgnify:CR=1 FL=1